MIRYQIQCDTCHWVIRRDTEEAVRNAADAHRCGSHTGPICSFPGCGRQSKYRWGELCSSHVKQLERGRPLGPLRPPVLPDRMPELDRFIANRRARGIPRRGVPA